MDRNERSTSAPSAWIELPGFDWRALPDEGGRKVQFDKGQTLFSQGDAVTHVYVVEQGRVRLVLMSVAGHEKHMAIVGTNGMVGECSAFIDGKHSVTAVASSDVVARQVSREQLLGCISRDAVCLRQVLWLGNVKLRILANQNLLLSHASAAQRVAYHLVQLAETYGEEAAQGIALRISFTHQEMANITGLSRVMTSNGLTQLHGQGLFEKVGSHCVIHDLQGLRQRALSM